MPKIRYFLKESVKFHLGILLPHPKAINFIFPSMHFIIYHSGCASEKYVAHVTIMLIWGMRECMYVDLVYPPSLKLIKELLDTDIFQRDSKDFTII